MPYFFRFAAEEVKKTRKSITCFPWLHFMFLHQRDCGPFLPEHLIIAQEVVNSALLSAGLLLWSHKTKSQFRWLCQSAFIVISRFPMFIQCIHILFRYFYKRNIIFLKKERTWSNRFLLYPWLEGTYTHANHPERGFCKRREINNKIPSLLIFLCTNNEAVLLHRVY